jgi:recombination protein RecT
MMSKEVSKQQTGLQALSGFLKSDKILQEIEKTLGRKPDSFVTSALTAIGSNDLLKDADKKTVYTALMTAASMSLPINPNLGFAYLVPFKNNKKGVVECQFQMGYKGYIQLAQRSGKYKGIGAAPIFEGQLIENNPLYGFKFDFNVPAKGKPIGYAAHFELLNGFSKTFYMSIKEIEAHAGKFSQTFKRGFGLWKDDFDSMAIKTVLKLLISKYGPLSTEMERAVLSDSAVVKDAETIDVDYVDNQTLSIDQTQEAQERERLINFIKGAKSLDDLKQIESEVSEYDLSEAYMLKFEELKQ